MALNFGSFFEKLIGQDLRDLASKGAKSMSDFSRNFTDVTEDMAKEINEVGSELRDLTKTMEAYQHTIDSQKKRVDELKDASEDLRKTELERLQALYDLDVANARLRQTELERREIERDFEKKSKKRNKEEKDSNKKKIDMSKLTFENVAKNNAQMYEDFHATGRATSAITGRVMTDFEEIEQEVTGSKLAAGFNLITTKFKDFGPEMGNMVGDAASDALGKMGAAFGPLGSVLGQTLGKTIGKAVSQMAQLNEAIVNLTRATGGMVNAAMLGSSEFGNIKGTFGSLQAAVVGANLSMEEFSDAIKSLMVDGMGAVAGAAKIGAGDLKDYGLEAARYTKMYGADISGSVRNIFKNWRMPLKDITASFDNAAMKISAAGLSVAEFTKHLEAVTELSGEVYFKGGIDAMERMAETATRLGTSVSALTEGLQQMNSLTDLYTQQQKAAAMGMHNLGRNMAKVFALKQAGKTEEAANVRLASAAHDLSQFMDKQGKITQQGIATAQGMGMSAEDVNNIERMTAGAKAAGMSIEKFLGPLDDLTEAEKKARREQEAKSRSLKERWDIATQTFMHSFIDPIANLFEPVLNSLMSAFEGVMSVLSAAGKIVMSVLVVPFKAVAGFFSGIFDTIGEVFGDIGDKLSNMWKAVEPAVSAIGSALSWVGNLLGKVLGTPLKIIGTVIGWLIDGITWLVEGITDLVSWIGDKLQPVFSWLGEAAGKVGDGLSWLWDKVKKAFQPIIDLFGWFGEIIEPVKKFFSLFISDDAEEVLSDAEAVQAMTNEAIASQLANPEVTTQEVSPTNSITQGVEAAAKKETATAGEQMREGMTQGYTPNVNVKVENKNSLFGSSLKDKTTNAS